MYLMIRLISVEINMTKIKLYQNKYKWYLNIKRNLSKTNKNIFFVNRYLYDSLYSINKYEIW